MKSQIRTHIQALRKAMNEAQIGAYIITGTDPHQSEYLASFFNLRQWASGFTGSAGQLVITPDFAGLWTDSRYFLQGEEELNGTGITLMKQKVQFHPEHIQWISDNVAKGATIAVDYATLSVAAYAQMHKALGTTHKLKHDANLVASVWTDRGDMPLDAVYRLDESYIGTSSKDKLKSLHDWLAQKNLNGMIINTLDDIAWLLNLRGGDVPYNPVFFAYLMVNNSQVKLYAHGDKFDDLIKSYFNEISVELKPYDAIFNDLHQLTISDNIGYDASQCNQAMLLASNATLVKHQNPIVLWKAVKNQTELNNTRLAMIKDGVALTKTFMFIAKSLESGMAMTEHNVSEKLTQFRSEEEGYIQDSFASIVGYKGNGAIIHYHPTEEHSAAINSKGVLLIDSGGQYKYGTTDITRTISLSTVSDSTKSHYTRVLKGMIALSKAIFPKGTAGVQLDILARQFLWEEGLNYGHGTGHGVGYCLNVHEPPQGFAGLNSSRGTTGFEAGMITSNEPGYYLTGEYGIRIENLLLTVNHDEKGDFLRFETLTMFPIAKEMILGDLMSNDEIEWLNTYHTNVYATLEPYLDEDGKTWLKTKCASF